VISAILLFGCSEAPTTSEKKDSDTTSAITKVDRSTMPSYDPAMDPLTAGAAFSKKLYDTLNMKIFEVTLKPGDSIALHTHPDHTVYILQGGKAEIISQDETRGTMETNAGDGWITGPYTDQVKNIGKTTIKWVEIDVYRPRGK